MIFSALTLKLIPVDLVEDRSIKVVNCCPFFGIMVKARVPSQAPSEERKSISSKSTIAKEAYQESENIKNFTCKIFEYRTTPHFLDYTYLRKLFLKELA